MKRASAVFLLILIGANAFSSSRLPLSMVTAGTTYYVSTGGNDLNSGSILLPFRTIRKVTGLVKPGDTVYIRGGIYHESNTFYTNGASDAPIVISGYAGETAVIDGSAYIYRAFFALPPLNNSKGLQTNAVYGFTTMLLKALREKGLLIHARIAHPGWFENVFLQVVLVTLPGDLLDDLSQHLVASAEANDMAPAPDMSRKIDIPAFAAEGCKVSHGRFGAGDDSQLRIGWNHFAGLNETDGRGFTLVLSFAFCGNLCGSLLPFRRCEQIPID